jgi:hypothetical protein
MQAVVWLLRSVCWCLALPMVLLATLPARAQPSLLAEWTVEVRDDPNLRTLQIKAMLPDTNGVANLEARYGMQGQKLKPVRADIAQEGGTRRLNLVTPADSVITAAELPDGSFEGSMRFASGKVRPVRITRAASSAAARPSADIHMVVMGGNDCPPCVAWRGLELPKLRAMPAFQSIRFSYVVKVITSAVPSATFLPDEVKPYKTQLDDASSLRTGSPQVAILVDGRIYDYYFGTRSAEEVVRMIHAIQEGGPYPFQRCLKRGGDRQCRKPA